MRKRLENNHQYASTLPAVLMSYYQATFVVIDIILFIINKLFRPPRIDSKEKVTESHTRNLTSGVTETSLKMVFNFLSILIFN